MRLLRSTTSRLALAVSVAFLLAFIVLGTGVYAAVSTLLERDAHEVVRTDAAGLRDLYRHAGYARLREELQGRIGTPDDPDMVYMLLDARGEVIVGTLASVPGWTAHARWLQFTDVEADDAPRVVAHQQRLDNGQYLVAGLRMRSEDGFLRLILHSALAALLAAAVMGAMVGGWTSRWVARRLGSLDRTAERVAAGEMDLRVRSDGSGDAFDRVALRFNGMLDRIQALLDAVRHATDHIAHDLRTPLSRLRTRLEAMRAVPAITASPAALAELESGLAEADGLLQSFSALLRLSRIEAQAATTDDATVVDLDQLVADVVELYQPVAAQRGMRLCVSGVPLQVAGDPDQLFQVLVNLLDNALKYGPTGGTVSVETAVDGEHAVLRIRDQGPGIPEGDRQRVFDRFERLQADRGQAGTGLGLSLVRAIVSRHRGTVVLSAGDPGPGGTPGLCVTVQLPRRPPAALA